MPKPATRQQLDELATQLNNERDLPHRANAEQLHVAYSHVFRHPEDALSFAKNILMGEGESLIGGHTEDSIGDLWWVGVRIDDIEQWRANGGFHHVARQDPEAPGNDML